jgi:hypothetical protein
MSAQYLSTILDWFDTRMAAVTSEGANAVGGGFKASTYRVEPENEADCAAEGLYYLDTDEIGPQKRDWGTGENFWSARVTIQLGFFRGGGGDGSSRAATARAADDVMKVIDVCENPSYYNSGTTGIRRVVYEVPARRTARLKRFDLWEVTLTVEWRSDAITA